MINPETKFYICILCKDKPVNRPALAIQKAELQPALLFTICEPCKR